MPPGSCAASASAPRTRCSDARRFEPASVSVSVPVENWNSSKRLPARRLARRRRPSAAGRRSSGGSRCRGRRRSRTPGACRARRSPVTRRPSKTGRRRVDRAQQERRVDLQRLELARRGSAARALPDTPRRRAARAWRAGSPAPLRPCNRRAALSTAGCSSGAAWRRSGRPARHDACFSMVVTEESDVMPEERYDDSFRSVERRPRVPSPGLAAVLSVIVPGLGHVYAGRLARGPRLVPGGELRLLGDPRAGLPDPRRQRVLRLPGREGLPGYD